MQILEERFISEILPKRKEDSHKGTYGKCLMIGGSARMHGAITLCAKAALRSGIGTLTLFVPSCIREIISMKLDEAMLIPAPCNEEGYFSLEATSLLEKELSQFEFVVIGNGIGRGIGARKLLETVLFSHLPCIIDGDALYLLKDYKHLLHRDAAVLLTPHPKELSYLSAYPLEEIKIHREQILAAFCKTYPNVCIIAKDAKTMIAYQKDFFLNVIGNHGLAKGGSGDVLCGICAGLYGQGKDMKTSAICGVYVHAKAADLLKESMSCTSMLPSDVIEKLSDVFCLLEKRENV